MPKLTALFLALLVTAACNDTSGFTAPPAEVTGIYTLRTVGGKTLPWTELQGTTTHTVAGGSVTLTDLGAYSISLFEEYTTSGVTTGRVVGTSGTFRLNGTTITMTTSDASEANTGTLANDSLSVVIDSNQPFVFSK